MKSVNLEVIRVLLKRMNPTSNSHLSQSSAMLRIPTFVAGHSQELRRLREHATLLFHSGMAFHATLCVKRNGDAMPIMYDTFRLTDSALPYAENAFDETNWERVSSSLLDKLETTLLQHSATESIHRMDVNRVA